MNRAGASVYKTANLKTSNSSIYKENTARRLKIDEITVQYLDKCIVECDPFDPSNITLGKLQSGQVTPADSPQIFPITLCYKEVILQVRW